MVSISYYLKSDIMLYKCKLIFNDFADHDGKNFTFSQKQFQLLKNAAKMPMYQNFVLGFALLQMLWQDKEKESLLVQNMIPLSRDAFKQLSPASKVTQHFQFSNKDINLVDRICTF